MKIPVNHTIPIYKVFPAVIYVYLLTGKHKNSVVNTSPKNYFIAMFAESASLSVAL